MDTRWARHESKPSGRRAKARLIIKGFTDPDLLDIESLFVRMPPDGVSGESREVWVQLLKTVNGLADGTRERRNCFRATARGVGFETSVLVPCVLVLRGS